MGLKAYLRLARIHTAGVTATVPVWGYLAGLRAAGMPFERWADAPTLFALALVGLLAHLFGLVHNEIADRESDTKVAYRRPKPLAEGEVSLRGANATAAIGLGGGLGVALLISLMSNPWPFVFSALAAVFAAAYNLRGKMFPGGEALLSLSIASFVLAGAAASGGLEAATGPAGLSFAAFGALVILINTGFEGSFKDRETDREAGKRTLIHWLESSRHPRAALQGAQTAVHFALFLVLALAVTGPFAAGPPEDLVRLLAVAAAAVAMAWLFFAGTAAASREGVLVRFSAHEILAVGVAPVLLYPFVPPALAGGLFAAPLLWYLAANFVVSGRLAAPDV